MGDARRCAERLSLEQCAGSSEGGGDGLMQVAPLLEIAGNWRRLLTSAVSEEQLKEFREHGRTGRVLGDDDFQKRLEKKLGHGRFSGPASC